MKFLLSILATISLGVGAYFLPSTPLPPFERMSPPQQLVETPRFTFAPIATYEEVGWQKFPDFHLPDAYTVVLQAGRSTTDKDCIPLRKGFTHLHYTILSEQERRTLPLQKQAVMLGANFFTDAGFSFCNFNKGYLDPFADDDQKFVQHVRGFDAPYGIVVFDLENVPWKPVKYEQDGFRQKTYLAPNSPGLKIPDNQFVEAYKQAMARKYTLMVKTLKKEKAKPYTLVGTYSPGCPSENFHGRPDYLNAYTDPNFKQWIWDYAVGGERFNQYCDIQTPGSYFRIAGEQHPTNWLYQLLMDQEVNAAWSKLPRIPVQWMFYTNNENKAISPQMAEGTAIFNILTGAKGIWLWDRGNFITPQKTPTIVGADGQTYQLRNYASYEYFMAGLYRLSKHNDLLAKQSQAIIPEISTDNGQTFNAYNAAQCRKANKPIARALVAGNEILVAACNPLATTNQRTELVVKVGNWKDLIVLKGNEVYLGRARMN
ncbi:MAG: hypothetical protein U0Y10_13865 [Spirosomataceae bacterium]